MSVMGGEAVSPGGGGTFCLSVGSDFGNSHPQI